MRLLKDEAYIFSMARKDPGKIIACRTRSMEDAVGKNLFSYLKMPSREVSFVTEEIGSYGKATIAALCGRKQEKAVLFCKYFTYDTSLCLAVTLDLPPQSVACLFREGLFDEIHMSEGLLALSAEGKPTDADIETYQYLSRIFSPLLTLGELRLQYEPENAHIMQSCAIEAAEFVGVGIDCNVVLPPLDSPYPEDRSVFDGRFCAAMFLSMAMLARAYSKDRVLRLNIVHGFGSVTLDFSFETQDERWREAMEYLQDLAQSGLGMILDMDHNEGMVKASLWPFYSDAGFVGVKRGELEMYIADFRELF